jgi:hypothetical protein
MNRLWPALLPELRRFPLDEQDDVLRAARRTELDFVELIGMATGLLVVTALTRYTLADAGMARSFLGTLVNFAVALPLLAIALGPFHIRRVRRGLRDQLRSKGPL